MTVHRNLIVLVGVLFLTMFTSGCATLPPILPVVRELPPILSQDELIRPYAMIGRIQVTRDVYGVIDTTLTSDIREWGFNAVRGEAAKMGADAVILAEVTGENITYLVVPTTEYRATGVAIKFK